MKKKRSVHKKTTPEHGKMREIIIRDQCEENFTF